MSHFYRLSYSVLRILLPTLDSRLPLSSTLQGQVIFSSDLERAELGPDWQSDPHVQWSTRDGSTFKLIEDPGGKLATTQSFTEVNNYVLETIMCSFEYGYWHGYHLTFSEQSIPNSSYALWDDAAFGGPLQLVKSTITLYSPEVLGDQSIGLNSVDPLRLSTLLSGKKGRAFTESLWMSKSYAEN